MAKRLVQGVLLLLEGLPTHAKWCLETLGATQRPALVLGRGAEARRWDGRYAWRCGAVSVKKQTDVAGHHSHRGRKGPCSHILEQGPGNHNGNMARRRDSSAAGGQINMVTSGGETGGEPRHAA